MKKTIIILSISLFFNNLYAQVKENLYAASSIPEELLKDAHAVVRQYDMSFTVKDMGTAIEKEHKIITILSEKGKHNAEVYFGYDKLTEIDDIEAAIFDASGKLVRNMKKKDIYDFKPYTEDVSDSRVKRIDFPHLPYPYTIEYTVTTINKRLMFYPNWQPQSDNRTAIQNATLDITLPKNMSNLRYKVLNGVGKPLESSTEKERKYVWILSKIPAFHEEPFLSATSINLPMVLTAPAEFEIDGFKGNMNTWLDLGKFQNVLNQGRDKLPEQTVEKIKDLVKDCTDDYCKIEKVYSYLQSTTRYFNIGIGIGGWQPIKAEDVDRRKYGDCKALSNYTVAMLKAVGVQAYYTLIYGGENNTRTIYEDFPSKFSNHIITCVPMGKDTVWLECTSQSEPYGYNGSFTGNRQALIVTPSGGQLVHTAVYDEKTNRAITTATVRIDTEGSADIDAQFVHTAIQQDRLADYVDKSMEDKKKFIYNSLGINNVVIKDFKFTRTRSRMPSVEQRVNFTVEPLASKSGKRLFVPINIFSKWTNVPSTDSTRHFDVQADNNGFTEQDSIVLKLPEGFKSETKFTPLSIKSLFGAFEMTLTEKSPTEVVLYRKLILNNHILPKEKFGELVDFLKSVAKADKTKLVLVQTGS